MKTTTSQSDLAGDNSKAIGGAMFSALFKGCLFVAVCWSAACVPPDGGWQSQPGWQAQQQPAAAHDDAESYDDTEHFFDEGSASGYGGDGGGGGGGGYGADSSGGGGGGGSSWSCKASATFVNDGPIQAMGAGNSRDEAHNHALSNCNAIFNTTMSTDQITERNRQVETDCTVTECNHWQ
jgi:hypothetical protein